MTITNNIAAKLSVAFVAVAMAFSLVAPAAQAQDVSSMSLEELIALVNSLQAQLSGSSSAGACSYTFTRSLSQGSTGTDVMNLQKFLNMSADTQVAATGVGSAGSESSYYGALTAAAVSKFQTKYSADILVPVGLTSPTGYFGPSTMAKANSVCAASTGSGSGTGSTGSTGLEGGAGSISDADYVSKLNNEEVGEDQEDVEVAGLELEADEGSDIELTAVNLNFSKSTGATSNFDKYADEVSVWVNGEEVARIDADEFTKSNNYDKTISLDNGGIIKAGETGELVVAVSGINNLDSTDATDKWTLEFESVRFRDAQGASVTDSSTGDINDATGRTFSFENFASATDLELKITSGDDDINDSQSVAVASTSDTDDVEILSFTLNLEGDSDVTIDALPITLVSSGTGDVDAIANTVSLWADGEQIGSESISAASASSSRQILFDNLDWELSAGDSIDVVVKVDVNDLDGSTFVAGDSLYAQIGESETDDSSADIVDENGDDLVDADKTGSETSEAHVFYADGIQVVENSVSTAVHPGDNADDDYVTLTIKFDVTAYGATAYVQNALDVTQGTTTSSTTPTNAVGVHVQSSDTDLVGSMISGVLSSTADEKTNSFEVKEGQTETFTITATVANASSSLLDGANVRAILAGVGFADTDSATSDQMYTSNLDDIKTDYAYIAN